MLKSETRDFLVKINRLFPAWKIDDYQATVDTWHKYLEKEELSYLEKAFDEYMGDGNKFAPSISELLSLSKKYKPDPRFEGVDYWENKTRGIYPYPWRMDVYRTWYTNDREAGRFHRYLQKGIQAVEEGRVNEEELRDLKYVIKVYEEKKCSMMKRD